MYHIEVGYLNVITSIYEIIIPFEDCIVKVQFEMDCDVTMVVAMVTMSNETLKIIKIREGYFWLRSCTGMQK